jgi:rhomboid protease GluP
VFVASSFDPDRWIFETFAKIDGPVRAGEVWRLFTASFLHAGVLHLWFNCTALVAIGPPVERAYGGLRYLALFLLGGAVGMAASVLFVPQPSVGASAGIFALLGVMLANLLRARDPLEPSVRRKLTTRLLVIVAINVGIGLFAGFIDNAAHLGGLAGGFVLGLLLRARAPLFAPPPP